MKTSLEPCPYFYLVIITGACSVCGEGGDCITGAKSVMENKRDQSVEISLKKQNPHIFFMLNFALKRVFGRQANFKTALKSYVLDYLYVTRFKYYNNRVIVSFILGTNTFTFKKAAPRIQVSYTECE